MSESVRALLTVNLKAICGGTGAEEAEGPGMEGKKQHGGVFRWACGAS